MFVETDDENDEIIEPNECQSVTRDFFNIHGYPTPDPDENISGVDIEIYNVEIIKRNEIQGPRHRGAGDFPIAQQLLL